MVTIAILNINSVLDRLMCVVFWTKMCKICNFFYFAVTGASALIKRISSLGRSFYFEKGYEQNPSNTSYIFQLSVNFERKKFNYKIGCNLRTLLNIFLLKMNFDKSTIGLYLLLISSILIKFLEN